MKETNNTKRNIVLIVSGAFVLFISTMVVLESLFGSKKLPDVVDVGDGVISFEKK